MVMNCMPSGYRQNNRQPDSPWLKALLRGPFYAGEMPVLFDGFCNRIEFDRDHCHLCKKVKNVPQ